MGQKKRSMAKTTLSCLTRVLPKWSISSVFSIASRLAGVWVCKRSQDTDLWNPQKVWDLTKSEIQKERKPTLSTLVTNHSNFSLNCFYKSELKNKNKNILHLSLKTIRTVITLLSFASFIPLDGKLFVNNCLLLWNPLTEGHMCHKISGTQVNDWRCAAQNSLISHALARVVICLGFFFLFFIPPFHLSLFWNQLSS